MKKIHFLIILLVFSIFIVLWIDFEIIPYIETTARASKLNSILESIFLTYITSFIFYYIVVYLRESRDKKNTRSYVKRKVEEINISVKEFIEELRKIDDIDFKSKYPSKTELQEKLKTLDLASYIKSNRVFPISYEDYFKEHAKDVQKKIDRILILLPYLDSKFVDRMNQVYDCQFFSISSSVPKSKYLNSFVDRELTKQTNKPYKGFNFSILYPEQIENYLELVNNLNKYCP